jgi:two-component system, NarL family, sensor kinase
MKMKYRLFLFFCYMFCNLLPVVAQFPQLDAAKAAVYASKNDAEKLGKLLELSKHRNSMSSDTILFYARWAADLAQKLNNKRALAFSAYNLITADLVRGKTDSVIPKIEKNNLFTNVKDLDAGLYFKIQLLKANILNRQDKRAEALDLELKMLAEAEKAQHTLSQLFLMNYIGATYLNTNNYPEAVKTWKTAYGIIKEKNSPENEEIETYIQNNFIKYYLNLYAGNPTPALKDTIIFFLEKNIALCKKTESMGVLATALSYQALFHNLQKQTTLAEADLKEALLIRKKIDDPLYIIDDYKNLANFYLLNKQYDKCFSAANEGLSVCNIKKITEPSIELYGVIARACKMQNNYKDYSATLEKIMVLADSSRQINSQEKIADIQTKYEVQKKETLIMQQKLDLFRRNIFLYGGGIAIILLLSFLGYRFKKYQQRQKMEMEQKRKQNELAVKDAEENERKRIAAELHDNLGVQANAILHSSSLLSGEKENNKNIVEDLQDTAKEMLLNLRETLWAMKTTDVMAKDLWLRIINFMKQMSRHYTGIEFKLEGEAPENFIITSNRALNIVLVLQETVNNAVKHASAKTITAKSIIQSNSWQLVIEDDGKGFNPAEAVLKNEGYGLANIGERAKAGNFTAVIEPGFTRGTIATISIAT